MSLRKRIIVNAGSNWASMFVTAAVVLVFVRIIPHNLGWASYGVWALLSTGLRYPMILERAFSLSINRFVALYRDDCDQLNRFVSASFVILLALAVLTVLMLGVRSSEILRRRVRDVDLAGGAVTLWIEEAKTQAGERRADVPEPLAGLLVRRAAGRGPREWLLPADTGTGHRRREWLCAACVRLCAAAEVPRVTPQGLRGTWSTLAVERGVVAEVVAAELGHVGAEVTRGHYIEAGAEDRAKARRVLRVVKSGSGETIESPIVSPKKKGLPTRSESPTKSMPRKGLEPSLSCPN